MISPAIKEVSSVPIQTVAAVLASDTLSESKLLQILTAAKKPSFLSEVSF